MIRGAFFAGKTIRRIFIPTFVKTFKTTLKSMRFIITSLLLLIGLAAQALDKSFQIIPLPQKIEALTGKGIEGSALRWIVRSDSADMHVLGSLLDALPRAKAKGVGIMLTLTDKDVPQSEEGYVLTLNSRGAHISSRGEAGLFYGCQTLQQLMEDSRDTGKAIPAVRITDWPQIKYRAVHLDTKHHRDALSYYYAMIDKLARYKVNAIIWELEDKFGYTRHPEIAAKNAISKQDMTAICEYAAKRHIDISPLVQGLGHASFILKHHWELRENPASDWEFCPSNPKTYEMLFDLYSDVFDAMPRSKYLHVGGDEITAIGIDERCKATGKAPFELQMIWLKKVCGFANEHGRTPIFWDDMPIKFAGLWSLVLSQKSEEEVAEKWTTQKLDAAVDMFPKDCIYMRWSYHDPTGAAHRRLLNWYRDKGLRVMAATAASAADSPYMPRDSSRTRYIRDFSRLTADNNLEGILATAWDDGSPHLETVWRGYIAQGEYGWNPYGRAIPDYLEAHAQREFGLPAGNKATEFILEMEKAFAFFDSALITSGRRNPAWGVTTHTLLSLPDKDQPGKWSAENSDRLAKAAQEAKRYKKICAGIDKAKTEATRSRNILDVYEQTNNLQNFPVRLLLTLQSYDMAKDKASRNAALREIEATCDYFDTMRANLLEVYGRTRFMNQFDGYIPDSNHHNHLAAKTENSDWIFLYEKPMVAKVRKWLRE